MNSLEKKARLELYKDAAGCFEQISTIISDVITLAHIVISFYKGFSLRLWAGSRVRHKTCEEGRRRYRPKRREYKNKEYSK